MICAKKEVVRPASPLRGAGRRRGRARRRLDGGRRRQDSGGAPARAPPPAIDAAPTRRCSSAPAFTAVRRAVGCGAAARGWRGDGDRERRARTSTAGNTARAGSIEEGSVEEGRVAGTPPRGRRPGSVCRRHPASRGDWEEPRRHCASVGAPTPQRRRLRRPVSTAARRATGIDQRRGPRGSASRSTMGRLGRLGQCRPGAAAGHGRSATKGPGYLSSAGGGGSIKASAASLRKGVAPPDRPRSGRRGRWRRQRGQRMRVLDDTARGAAAPPRRGAASVTRPGSGWPSEIWLNA